MFAIFIDADGTIWYENPVKYALLDVAKFLAKLVKRPAEDLWEELQEEQPRLIDERKFLEAYDWESIVRRFAEELAEGTGEEAVKVFYESIRKHSEHVKLLEGVREALEELKSRGHRLVVLSNSFKRFVEEPLKAKKLDILFDGIVTPDTVAEDKLFREWAPPIKPFRPIYIYGMVRYPADAFVFVGDDYLKDGIGPLRCGFVAAFVFKKEFDPSQYLVESVMSIDGDVRAGEFSPMVVSGWNEIPKRIKELEKRLLGLSIRSLS